MTRSKFLVGRRTAKSTLVLVLKEETPRVPELAPIIGPWTLTAMVSAN